MSAPVTPRVGPRRGTGLRPYPRQRCELCLLPIGAEHRHLADTAQRVLACACPACALLFDGEGAAGGRFRTVPERFLYDPGWDGGDADWDALGTPAGGVAFFLRNSALGRIVALHPGPAGAAEAEVDPGAWERAFGGSALARALADDVEALLVHRREHRTDCHLVPVDTAYGLAGRLRPALSGSGGADAVRAELDAFTGWLAQRARPLAEHPGTPAH